MRSRHHVSAANVREGVVRTPMKKISILLADDHKLMRMGLAALINVQNDMAVVGEAENGEDAVRLVHELKPDIVIMDLMMPKVGGADATRRILASQPETGIVVLSSFTTSADLAHAVQAGARGAQAKEAPTEDLIAAVRTVAHGGMAIAPEIQQFLDENNFPVLTQRQADILASVIRGLSNSDIAKQFDLSPISVKKHLSVVFAKIGAANRAEAVAIALKRHLLKT